MIQVNPKRNLGISKDDINSMTVAQLKEKLAEIGTPVTKGMKKRELRLNTSCIMR